MGRRQVRGSLGRWVWLVIGLGCAGLVLGVEPAEQLAFEAAVRDSDLAQWERAVRNLAEFEAKFPQSEFKPDAVKRRLFGEAEVKLAASDWPAAAAAFAEFQKAYPTESLSGLAAVREAQARLKLNERAAALRILESTNSAFARQLALGTNSATLFTGLLVKAELLRDEQRWGDAEAALAAAAPLAQTPADQATRWGLLAAVEEGAGHFEVGAQAAEQWGVALGTDGPVDRRAEAAAVAGRLWTRAGKLAEARAAYARNLGAGIPQNRQLEAVVASADIALARGELPAAREGLQSYLTTHAGDPGAAAVRLRLGQTLFRQFLAGGGLTNTTPDALALLTQSAGQFADGLTNDPPAALVGPLRLGRGWALWQEGMAANNLERFRDAGTNFAVASTNFPHGSEQATARFKWGEVQLRLGEPAAALTNFLAVVGEYHDVPAVQSELVTPALIQGALAAVSADKAEAAAPLVEQLLARQPTAEEVEPSLLLVGQALAKSGQAERARAVFEKFLAAYPQAKVAAEIELALAGVELRVRRWPQAIAALDHWVSVYTNHPSLPRAEFDRAWAAAQAGFMTNAVGQFAALSVRFPTNPIAQTASLWLAGNYFSMGDYARAEQACVTVLTNAAWRGTPEWHQARLWAAEAARQRQSFGTAREQLMELLNDRATPTNLVPSAYFALGETQLEQAPAPDQAPLANYQQALETFTAAARYTNSPVAIAAVGKMADCHLQLATRATNSYAKADELYRRVQESPQADLASRCKATMGRGIVAERVAAGGGPAAAAPLLAAALNFYLDVVNGTLTRPGEVPDPWWLKEAGREAGRLLESLGRWQEAAALYDRLGRELPALKSTWDSRAAEARKRASG